MMRSPLKNKLLVSVPNRPTQSQRTRPAASRISTRQRRLLSMIEWDSGMRKERGSNLGATEERKSGRCACEIVLQTDLRISKGLLPA